MQISDFPRVRDQKTIEEQLQDSEGKHFNLEFCDQAINQGEYRMKHS